MGPEKEKKTHYYGHHTRKVVVGLKKKPISRQFFLHFYITGVDLSMLVAILTMKNLKLFQTKEMNGEIHELTQRKPENFTHLIPLAAPKKWQHFALFVAVKDFDNGIVLFGS